MEGVEPLNKIPIQKVKEKSITTALFVYSWVVSRHSKSMKIDFPVTLMVYHRKISNIYLKTKCLGKLSIYQRLDQSASKRERRAFLYSTMRELVCNGQLWARVALRQRLFNNGSFLFVFELCQKYSASKDGP